MRWTKPGLLAAGVVVATALASAGAVAETSGYNYLLHCGGCHIEDGSGLPPHVPDLRVDMPYFAAFTEGRSYMARVPGVMHAPLTTEQLVQVMNLILLRFAPPGANLQPYSVEEITLYQQQVLLDAKKLRDQLLSQKPAVISVAVTSE